MTTRKEAIDLNNKKINVKLIPILLKYIQGDDSEKIYKYLEQQDDGVLVLHLMKVLKSIYAKTEFKKNIKCLEKCNAFIREGSSLIRKNKITEALKSYNQAIAFAPKSALKTAYAKRSELYFGNGLIDESINDIDLCLKFTDTEILIDKLNKLKLERSKKKNSTKEMSAKWDSDFVKEYFKLNKVNKNVPCASALIDFTTNGNQTKAVAAKPIKAGTVLAIETAFVHDKEESLTTCCHYCLKQSFNVIPCEDCTSVFFCSDKCKYKCLSEFHKAECSVMDLIESSPSYTLKMAYEAAVKCRKLCTSWEEFIEISETLGEECILGPFSITDLFSANKTCLATWPQLEYLHLGRMFNCAMLTALTLGQAKSNALVPPSNLPLTKTLKALIKHMMFYQMNVRLTRIDIMTRIRNTQTIKETWAVGWFPFVGKLDRVCDANCIVVGLDNKAVLIAIKPIAVDERITVSIINHFHEPQSNDRMYDIFKATGYGCDCIACTQKWHQKSVTVIKSELSKEQSKFLKKINEKDMKKRLQNVKKVGENFELLCQGLDLFGHMPNSSYYRTIFTLFRELLRQMQCSYTQNISF